MTGRLSTTATAWQCIGLRALTHTDTHSRRQFCILWRLVLQVAQELMSPLANFALGASSKALATVVTFPIQTVRTLSASEPLHTRLSEHAKALQAWALPWQVGTRGGRAGGPPAPRLRARAVRAVRASSPEAVRAITANLWRPAASRPAGPRRRR